MPLYCRLGGQHARVPQAFTVASQIVHTGRIQYDPDRLQALRSLSASGAGLTTMVIAVPINLPWLEPGTYTESSTLEARCHEAAAGRRR
jgi:hypothetical protein